VKNELVSSTLGG
jgi:periodic tryptophan protein 2